MPVPSTVEIRSETSYFPHFPLTGLTVFLSYTEDLVVSTLLKRAADMSKVKHNWVRFRHIQLHKMALKTLRVHMKAQNIMHNDSISVCSL